MARQLLCNLCETTSWLCFAVAMSFLIILTNSVLVMDFCSICAHTTQGNVLAPFSEFGGAQDVNTSP